MIHNRKLFLRQSLVAAALVTLSLSSQADQLSFFGNFRGSINSMDDALCGSLDGDANCQNLGAAGEGYNGVSFQNNASVIGIKSVYRMHNIEAFGTYILRAQNDGTFGRGGLTTIIYQAGLRGTLGEISIGVGSTPYKISGLKLDPFWDTSASARGFDGPVVGLSDLTWGFTENLIRWNSTSIFESITLDVALILDDANSDQHDLNLGATYQLENVQLGLQYLSLSDNHPTAKSLSSGNAVRLWGVWQTSNLSINASLEKLDYVDSDELSETDSEQLHWMLSAEYTTTGSQQVSVSFGDSKSEEQRFLNGRGVSLGWFYQLLPQVELYTLASKVQRRKAVPDRTVFALGFNYQFSLNR